MTKIVNKKKKTRTKYDIAFVVMAVVAILIIIGTGTYAYYQTTIAGNTSGTIAKWSFKANNQTETFNLDFGALYPGKSGVYNLELSAEDSDLDVYYELVFDTLPYPIRYNLYWDPSYQNIVGKTNCERVGIYGTITAGEKIIIPLYYNWPYDNKNYADDSLVTTNILIVAQQLTGYSGTTPLQLLGDNYTDGFINLVCR